LSRTRLISGPNYGDKIVAGVIAVSTIAIVSEQGLRALVRASQRYRQGQSA
jgi:ABC-type proline/glycine betaine transport system permease subunit